MSNKSNKKIKIHLPELDLLRGLAALFMVINHTGYTLFPDTFTAQHVQISALLLITSYAPALFFFSSGVGSGIQSITKNSRLQLKPTLYKFTLLMIADAFFAWSAGKVWGFDFLGFIAIIVMILELVRCSKYPRALCAIGIILIFILRFVLGPELHFGTENTTSTLATWLMGADTIIGSAYPFSPWFTYPLIGFLLGSFIAKNHTSLLIKTIRHNFILIVAALAFAIASYYLSTHAYEFSRWGSMSFAFYCLSFSVIPFSIITVSTLHRLTQQKHFKLFYLSGTASLAIVPIHFFIIHLTKNFNMVAINNIGLSILWLVLILLTSFILAKLMDNVAQKTQQYVSSPFLVPCFWVAILILAVATYCLSSSMPELSKFARTLGQLTICILFTLRLKKP